MGIKSQNSLGGLGQIGSSIRSREEIFVGLRAPSGWGASLIARYNMKAGNIQSPSGRGSGKSGLRAKDLSQNPTDPTGGDGDSLFTNRTGFQDPSLAITHPIYKSDNVDVAGMLRQNIPLSELSRNMHVLSESYYINHRRQLKNRYHVTNTLGIRYISKDQVISPMDTVTSIGYMTALGRRLGEKTRWVS